MFADQEIGGDPIPLRPFPVKTLGGRRGSAWATLDTAGLHGPLEKHPPGPGKSQDPTGDWGPQETAHWLHHFFRTKSSFESVNGGFMQYVLIHKLVSL